MKVKTKHTAADVVDALNAVVNPNQQRPIFVVQDIEPVVDQMLAYLRLSENTSISSREVFCAIAEDNRIRILDSTNAKEYLAQDISPFCFGASHSKTKPTQTGRRKRRR